MALLVTSKCISIAGWQANAAVGYPIGCVPDAHVQLQSNSCTSQLLRPKRHGTPTAEPYTRGLVVSTPCIGTQQPHRSAFIGSPPCHMRCSGVMTPGGRPSTTPIHRKLAGLRLGGFLLGTEVPAASYATYDVLEGAEALRSILQPQHVAPSSVQSTNSTMQADEAQARAVRAFASEHEPHVKTLAFPPPELTLLALHRFLAEAFPVVACARWDLWRVDTPASCHLQDEKSCSMALRFLQHYVDKQQGAVDEG